MTLLNRFTTFGSFLFLAAGMACSDSGGDGGNTAAGGTAAGGSAGVAGNSAGSGGAAGAATGASGSAGASAGSGGAAAGSGGTPAAGSGGESAGGAGGSAGEQAGGAGGEGGASGTPPEGPFTCTEYIGAYLTMEWYNGHNFEDKLMAEGGDPDKWQLKWHHHGHVNEWNNPDSPFWANEGDPNNDASGSPIGSPCAEGSDAPDRIVILTIDWDMLTEEEWLPAVNKLIETIQLKRPNAKRIDLMPLMRCPDNQMCNPNADYGPGAGTSAGRQDCYIIPEQDSAFEKAIAAHSNIAAWGPVLEATQCNPSHDGAHLTGDDNELQAQLVAEFYAAQP